MKTNKFRTAVIFALILLTVTWLYVASRPLPEGQITYIVGVDNPAAKSKAIKFQFDSSYLDPTSPDMGSEGFDLLVSYPSAAPLAREDDLSPQRVRVLVRDGRIKGGFAAVGDRLNNLLDDGRLDDETGLEVYKKTYEMIYLRHHNENVGSDDDNYLFFDEKRRHWIYSSESFDAYGDATVPILNGAISVTYSFEWKAEPHPIVMHNWVMSFVESLVVSDQ